MKWYAEKQVDQSEMISSRVRLARNLKKYPYALKINDEQAREMLQEVVNAIKNDRNPLGEQMEFYQVNKLDDAQRHAMVERHIISPLLMGKKQDCGVLKAKDESMSVMINEEDHVRIQTIFPGDKIKEAYDLADKVDDLIEESISYAFDKDYGFLTSCPTNVGSGLRASFMVHLPLLTQTGQLKQIMDTIAKFGVTIRGIYGEGSKGVGNIYQISNQVTIGLTEEEIIGNLIQITNQIIEKEKQLRQTILDNQRNVLADKVYRSYGLLRYCRSIGAEEAMNLLSDVRLGFMTGLLEEKQPQGSIYEMMIEIQPGNMQKRALEQNKNRDIVRAEYIRKNLSE